MQCSCSKAVFLALILSILSLGFPPLAAAQESVSGSPGSASERAVINFGDLSDEEAAATPGCQRWFILHCQGRGWRLSPNRVSLQARSLTLLQQRPPYVRRDVVILEIRGPLKTESLNTNNYS